MRLSVLISQNTESMGPPTSTHTTLPFAHIVSTLCTMASSRIVQILLRALLELLKKAVSKAAVPVRILWTVLRILVPVSRRRRDHIDSDSTRCATTHATLPPLLDSTETPVPSALNSSSPNVNGAGPSSDRTLTADIQFSSSGRIGEPDSEGENRNYLQPTIPSPIEMAAVEWEMNLWPTSPSNLRRYNRIVRVYVSSHHLLRLLNLTIVKTKEIFAMDGGILYIAAYILVGNFQITSCLKFIHVPNKCVASIPDHL